MKYYFFRDLDNEPNLFDGLTYHSAGLVSEFNSEIGCPAKNGKDVVVRFFDPFDGGINTSYRAFNEVELFEVDEHVYSSLRKVHDAIDLIPIDL
jgi:hypothetical protein